MKLLIYVTVFFVLASCNNSANQPNHGKESKRISYLADLMKKTGFLKLPISCNILKADFKANYTTEGNSIDSLFFESGNIEVCGFLPDTSNYYGILYYQIGDLSYPKLMTIDKQGFVIDKKELCLDVCGPPVDVDSSINRFEIDKDLTIKLFYYCHGKVQTEDEKQLMVKVQEQKKGIGNITKKGKIKLTISTTK